jgi:hypothetical protein
MFRIVFWDVLPCKMIVDRRFRGAYCLSHSSLMMEAVHPRRQFWTSYSPPWELEISHNSWFFLSLSLYRNHHNPLLLKPIRNTNRKFTDDVPLFAWIYCINLHLPVVCYIPSLKNKQIPSLTRICTDNPLIITYFSAVPHLESVPVCKIQPKSRFLLSLHQSYQSCLLAKHTRNTNRRLTNVETMGAI